MVKLWTWFICSATFFSALTWSLLGAVVVVTSILFMVIVWFHQKLGHHTVKPLSYWEIPLQTLESVFEYRMPEFFAPAITSAKFLRFFFILFIAFFVMFYTSNLRANLMAKRTDQPINTVEVLESIFHSKHFIPCVTFQYILALGLGWERYDSRHSTCITSSPICRSKKECIPLQ